MAVQHSDHRFGRRGKMKVTCVRNFAKRGQYGMSKSSILHDEIVFVAHDHSRFAFHEMTVFCDK